MIRGVVFSSWFLWKTCKPGQSWSAREIDPASDQVFVLFLVIPSGQLWWWSRKKKIFAFGTNLQALSQSKPITKRVDIDCSPLHIDWLQVGSVCGICQLLSAQHNSHSSSRDRVDFSMVAIPLIKLRLAARSVWSIYFQCAGDHAAKPSLWIFSLPFCHVCLSSWHARYIQG